MKKVWLISLILVLLLPLALASCGGDDGETTPAATTTGAVTTAPAPAPTGASLGGRPIADFTIVPDSESAVIAKYLQTRIAEATGTVLPIAKANGTAENGCEILVGNVTGDRAPATPAAGKYVIEMRGTRLALFGDGKDGAYSAAMAFAARVAATPTAELGTGATGDVTDTSLFTLNLSPTLTSNVGKYDIEITAESSLDRFLAAKAELPDEVTVLERVDLADYPISQANELFVAKSGSDENPGTKEAPLATLTAALARMQNAGGGVIWMMEGTYTVDATVKTTAAHSGTRQSPLFIKAYGEAEVTLTSNLVLSNDEAKWQRIAATDPIYDRLPEAARGAVMKTTLADHGLAADDIAPISKENGPPRLYVGEEQYTLARYPNDTGDIIDLLYFTHAYDSGTVTTRDGSDLYWPWIERCEAAGKDPVNWIVGWEIRIPDDDARGQEIMSWVNTGDIWYYGSTFEGWEFGYYTLALETEGQSFAHNADGTAWVPGSGQTPYVGYPKGDGHYSLKSVQNNTWGCKVSTNSPAGRNTYYLFNAVEAMDAPGEWYMDRESGSLYLIPEEGFFEKEACFSSGKSFDLLVLEETKNLVLDGLRIDGANGYGIRTMHTTDVVMQNLTVSNTLYANVNLNGKTERTAIIYSDFSRSYETMIKTSMTDSFYSLTPTDVVIQNNVFHDAMPTYQNGIIMSGCRVVISHNYFHNTIIGAGRTTECILEYNRFEGGSADVTDGGMIYTGGVGHRGNHYRYNLIHMFNATHNAIYNDGTSSHHYAYGNMISFLGSKSNLNKGWYSSTGIGNVFFGNTVILRNPYQVAAANSPAGYEGDVKPAASGDVLNESALFYYHFGDEYSAGGTAGRYYPVAYDGTPQLDTYLSQSLAGHWWAGMKADEWSFYVERGDEDAWAARDPQFMNFLYGTRIVIGALEGSDYHPKYFYVPWYLTGKTYTHGGIPEGTVVQIPQYSYLDADGEKVTVPAHSETVGADGTITLTYEEIAAMERFRRQPAASVVMNNVILGGTPERLKDPDGYSYYTETTDPATTITNGAMGYQGYVHTTMVDKNYFEYHYNDVMYDAENYNYDFFNYKYDEFAEIFDEEGLGIIEEGLWYYSGLTYDYDYSIWH